MEKKTNNRIHGYPIRVRVGRGSDREGHLGIWARAVGYKKLKNDKKVKRAPTDRPTNSPTSGVQGHVARDLKGNFITKKETQSNKQTMGWVVLIDGRRMVVLGAHRFHEAFIYFVNMPTVQLVWSTDCTCPIQEWGKKTEKMVAKA